MKNTAHYPIVIQALPRWDGDYAASIINLAKELSLKRYVFFVEHPYTWKDTLTLKGSPALERRKKQWKSGGALVEQPFSEYPNFHNISPSPVAPINFLPEGALYETLREKINRQIWVQVDKVLHSHGVDEFIYVNSFDPVLSLAPSRWRIALHIYHCVDDISGERYIARHGVKAEQEAMRQADLVITTSKPLQAYASQWNEKAYTVENAADFIHFSNPMPKPKDLEQINGPILLYVGNIGLRIDYELVASVASQHPDWQLVFIGPKNKREFQSYVLHVYPNIHFLGMRSYEQIPAYMQHATVCWIPFKCNKLTSHIYPLKINEYLAAGKPVITTPFARFGKLSQVVHCCENAQEIRQQLSLAHSNNTYAEAVVLRKQLASENTWTRRAKQWKDILGRALWRQVLCHQLTA